MHEQEDHIVYAFLSLARVYLLNLISVQTNLLTYE